MLKMSGGVRQVRTLETNTKHVATREETIDFEYGACVDKSPHSVDFGGFNMCGLVFNGMYEWGDPNIALRHKLAVQQAHEDCLYRDKVVSVETTFKLPPMSPCAVTKEGEDGSEYDWWILAYFTGLVAL